MTTTPTLAQEVGLANIPSYVTFVGVEGLMLVLAAAVFSAITPYDELKLVREGNKGAAWAFAGTLIALGIVINSIGAQTHGLIDLAIWTALGVGVQLLAFFALRLVFPNLFTKIRDEQCESHGTIIAGFSIGVALLNQAALTA